MDRAVGVEKLDVRCAAVSVLGRVTEEVRLCTEEIVVASGKVQGARKDDVVKLR